MGLWLKHIQTEKRVVRSQYFLTCEDVPIYLDVAQESLLTKVQQMYFLNVKL